MLKEIADRIAMAVAMISIALGMLLLAPAVLLLGRLSAPVAIIVLYPLAWLASRVSHEAEDKE